MKTTRLSPVILAPVIMALAATPCPARPPLVALVSANGEVAVMDGARTVLTVNPSQALTGWTGLKVRKTVPLGDGKKGRILELEGGGAVTVTAGAAQKGSGIELAYEFATTADLEMESVHVSMTSPSDYWVRAPYTVGSLKGIVPLVKADPVHLAMETARTMTLGPSGILGGLALKVSLASPAPLLLQDSRKWWPAVEMRVSADRKSPWKWKPGDTVRFRFVLSADRLIELVVDKPVTIKAGTRWIPYVPGYEVEKGSALDWSAQRPLQGRAGDRGWIVPSKVRPGTMEFESGPGKPVRIYGANLGTSAMHPAHEVADRLADRLARQGYSGLRVHHYESPPWVKNAGIIDWDAPDSLTLHPERMERFDYLVAACINRGIYITTDLYVSRMVRASEVYGPGATGDVAYKFKRLVHVSDKAMDNWKEFARRLLTHVNQFTGRAYRDEPALFQIVLVNEGNLANEMDDAKADPREKPLWDAAFAAWKLKTGATGDWGSPEFHRFLWETNQATQRRMIAFLKDELKVRAMLTDLNGWTDEWGTQACRADFDYVDNHFYWDHPDFFEKPWQQPSRGSSGGGSAIYALGGMDKHALTRLLDRPYALSEINYCPPNDFRGEAGLMIGAIGALQDWSSLWRFAYSDAFTLQPMGFFDIVTDPVAPVSEYAAVALYGRGDADPAKHSLAFSAPPAAYWARADEKVGGVLADLRTVLKVGTLVETGPVAADPDRITVPLAELPGNLDSLARTLGELKALGFLPAGNGTDPARGIWESETGQVRFDTGEGVMTVNTPRTAGMACAADSDLAMGPLKVKVTGGSAAIWVSSMDGKPLSESARMLFIHVTDVKQTGMKFLDARMRDMSDWGGLPLLARSGKARVSLKTSRAGKLKVWRLDPAGRRKGRVETAGRKGALEFTAVIAAGSPPAFYYEIAEK